ncbi:MAG: ribonuclease D [Gammaproteobacteria bacterium]|nr:ribonuclease D [Gammaproteobacteria bacterium]NNF50579.1 ribonuclease D [Woeseiaceae bacterium]MBT8094638.1 ribonuclease D [Gammaproteobacteria bacterium]MBT8106402.1 ribonuclease D [Gammaproteobacteria bacterium]NNK26417.1 ribonuclease D [Woeseiaceae bacterium]
MSAYQFVDEPDALVPALQQEDRLGVDTEFMRERTYYAQLCLTQVASRDDIWCVDPLSGHTQDAFWRELLDHDWVLHSARQDIEVVFQTAERMPASIFDTQVAAALLGFPAQVGYAGLVKELFDADIHKMHTRADWSRRPLRSEYLEYAAEDVEYLLPAYEMLSERLDAKGRLEWAREDSAWLLDPSLYTMENGQAVDRLKGARKLRGRRRAAAAMLADWREQEAIHRDRPRQWIMRDNVLVDIACRLPQSETELRGIESIPPKLVRRVGRYLLDAVANSARDERDYQPPRPPDEGQKALLKEMQSRVAACAKELGIAAETVASKRELSAVIIGGSRNSRLLSGWRAALIGDDLQELL